MKRYNITLPDRQLACVPIQSPEGQAYLAAMRASANFAWANRQVILHFLRGSLEKLFGKDVRVDLVYDVAHNIAKEETHIVDGQKRRVLVHRKGATRAFPPGHREIPAAYRQIGQPVLIPGSMGTASWVLVGTRARHAGDLRQRLPRRGPADVAHGRQERPQRARGAGTARAAGHSGAQ
jgi:tRNA-splicing ligase RtcB